MEATAQKGYSTYLRRMIRFCLSTKNNFSRWGGVPDLSRDAGFGPRSGPLESGNDGVLRSSIPLGVHTTVYADVLTFRVLGQEGWYTGDCGQ